MPGANGNQEPDGTGGQTDPTKGKAGEADPGKEGEGDPAPKELTPEEMKAEIAKLRKENAARRTGNKSLEERLTANEQMMGKMKEALGIKDPTETPEVVAQNLKAQNSVLELELGISQVALAHQIPADKAKYFNFLFKEKLQSLEEGEELDDEGIQELVSQVQSVSAAPAAGKSGVGGKTPPAGGSDEVDVAKFSKMSVMEKGELYTKKPDLYERLFAEARTKGML